MVLLTNKIEIEKFLRRDAGLHLYELGDLDDFFFPCTTWYGYENNDGVKAVALLYRGTELPVLLVLDAPDSAFMKELLNDIKGELPERFYCHLTSGLEKSLENRFILEPHGTHHKMVLTDSSSASFLVTKCKKA